VVAHLLAEDPVLFLEILDHVLMPAADPAGHREDQELK
jgi:hypothetical protein